MQVTYTPGFQEHECGCISRKHDAQIVHFCDKDGSTLTRDKPMRKGKTRKHRHKTSRQSERQQARNPPATKGRK